MAGAYQLRIAPKKGCLHARITGENTPEVTRAYVVDLVAACRQAKCAAVLIEENLEGPRMGMGELYSIVHDLHAEFRSAIHVAAFVDVNPLRSDANMRFRRGCVRQSGRRHGRLPNRRRSRSLAQEARVTIQTVCFVTRS